MDIYTYGLFQPLFNALIFLYNVIPGHDLGVAIIILTIIVKLILSPLSFKSIKAQKDLQKLQPELNNIKTKYKNDREKQSKEMMKFYKKNKINPLASCLPLLIQLPILIAMYRVFREGFMPETLDFLYPFVQHPGFVNPYFLGIVDLSVRSIPLAIAAGALQFVQSRQIQKSRPKPNPAEKGKDKTTDISTAMTNQMTYVLPFITVFIAWSLPSGLALYWIVTTLFAIVQQYYILKQKDGSNNNLNNK